MPFVGEVSCLTEDYDVYIIPKILKVQRNPSACTSPNLLLHFCILCKILELSMIWKVIIIAAISVDLIQLILWMICSYEKHCFQPALCLQAAYMLNSVCKKNKKNLVALISVSARESRCRQKTVTKSLQLHYAVKSVCAFTGVKVCSMSLNYYIFLLQYCK